MSFSNHAAGGAQAEINVTPLIDVLLVLLIIFMLIVPAHPNGVRASAPQPAAPTATPDPATPIVLQVRAGVDGAAVYTINEQATPFADVVERLRGMLRVRQERSVFVKGDRELEFARIAEAISLAHLASAEQVGILTASDEGRR